MDGFVVRSRDPGKQSTRYCTKSLSPRRSLMFLGLRFHFLEEYCVAGVDQLTDFFEKSTN